jgi:hypothetical protein
MTDTATPPEGGDGLQRLIAAGVSAFLQSKQQTAPIEHEERWKANTAFAESLEQEMKPLSSKLSEDLLARDDLPDGFRALLEEAAAPGHQFGWVLQVALFFGYFLGIIPAIMRVSSQTLINQLWQEALSVPISPADASDMVVRQILTRDEGATQAAMSGVSGSDFDNLVAITGEPPGPMDLLKLWLRGAIDKPTLEEAIRYSRIRDDYIAYVEQMAYSQMSPADAIELAVKQIVSNDDAAAYFERGGGLASDFNMLLDGAGNSIGAEAAMGLWNHGLIDQAEVERILAHTRINPSFYADAELLRHKFLGVIQIQSMIKAGTVSEADATSWLLADGYEADQVAAFVGAHSSTGGSTAKSETMGLVTSLYTDHLLTATEAEAALLDIGYTTEIADLIVANVDAKRALAQTSAAVGAVRAAYITRRITRLAASGDLDSLGVPADARDQWLTDWDVELSTHVKTLSEAQIVAAVKKSVFTTAEALARLEQLGYSSGDATVLIETAGFKV